MQIEIHNNEIKCKLSSTVTLAHLMGQLAPIADGTDVTCIHHQMTFDQSELVWTGGSMWAGVWV